MNDKCKNVSLPAPCGNSLILQVCLHLPLCLGELNSSIAFITPLFKATFSLQENKNEN